MEKGRPVCMRRGPSPVIIPSAVAALEGVVFKEGFLDWVQAPSRLKPSMVVLYHHARHSC